MRKYLAQRRLDRLEARLAHRPKPRYIKLYARIDDTLSTAVEVPLSLAPNHMHSAVVCDEYRRDIEIRAVIKAYEK